MKIGMVGLGKMGLNMALNLIDNGVDVIGYDSSKEVQRNAKTRGTYTVNSIQELLENLDDKKIVILSLPAGTITDKTIIELSKQLNPGDILIDSGNSYYKNSINNYKVAQENDVSFLDCGTSGGMEGARYGACLMIGGDREVFDQVEEIFNKLATDNGYLYTGDVGSGHYLKMIHNGIEYGMMQAIGEGFDILNTCDYDYNLEEVASVFNHGSVIRSWLIELLEDSFHNDENLEEIKGVAHASGEGKWTVEEALDLNIPVPVISASLFARNTSQIEDSFTIKVVSTMRNQFGGHSVVGMED